MQVQFVGDDPGGGERDVDGEVAQILEQALTAQDVGAVEDRTRQDGFAEIEADVHLLAEVSEAIGEGVEIGTHTGAELQERVVDLIECQRRLRQRRRRRSQINQSGIFSCLCEGCGTVNRGGDDGGPGDCRHGDRGSGTRNDVHESPPSLCVSCGRS